jgi:uncharacterized membrane protein YbhN (UPF0104 family)
MRFRQGAVLLLRARLLLFAVTCGAAYMALAGGAFYVVVHGAGLDGISVTQALAVYLFSFAISMLCPIPVDIGVQEVSGVGALVALGGQLPTALGVMLIYRLLNTAVPMAIALLAMIPLRDQLRCALGTNVSARSADAGTPVERDMAA